MSVAVKVSARPGGSSESFYLSLPLPILLRWGFIASHLLLLSALLCWALCHSGLEACEKRCPSLLCQLAPRLVLLMGRSGG